MSNQRFSPEFKHEAVRQIVDRGYSVAEVSEQLGASAHSLYKWVKAVKPDEQAVELIESRSEVLKLREWEDYYNYHRPHGALKGQTPFERLMDKTRAGVSRGS